jgi:aminoglycoside phosphotransferase (APT) family kinase protein
MKLAIKLETEPELRPLESTVAMDWQAVAKYLDSRGFHLDLPVAPRQFSGGLANCNFLVMINGQPAVLRRPPSADLPPGANDMRREHQILSRLWQELPLAPQSYLLCEDEDVIGVPFQILEYREGVVVRAELPAALASLPDIGGRLTRMLVDTLARIHQVDTARVGLADFGRPEGFLARAVAGWSKRAHLAADGAPPAVVRSITGWLHARKVPETTPTLLHNDFKLDNIILEPATLEPVAVLDWDQGTRGDPLFDLATLLSYWAEPGDPPVMHALHQMPTAQPGFPSRQDVVALYARATNRDVSHFEFYRVLAMFKLGVVFQQLHARYRRGETNDPRFAAFDRLAAELLEFTHDIALGRVF